MGCLCDTNENCALRSTPWLAVRLTLCDSVQEVMLERDYKRLPSFDYMVNGALCSLHVCRSLWDN